MLCAFIIVLIGIFISGRSSTTLELAHRLEHSTPQHPLGTDVLGRDLIACLGHGSILSIALSLSVTILCLSIGSFLGVIAASQGSVFDMVVCRSIDAALAFPGLLLSLLTVAFIGPGFSSLLFALTMSGWAIPARLIRSETIRLFNSEFIIAARSYNASTFHIIIYHILPGLVPTIRVQAVIGITQAILVESTLSFLGLGFDPRVPTLGQLIDLGVGHIHDAPRLMFIPALVLFWLVLSLTLIAEGMQEKARVHRSFSP